MIGQFIPGRSVVHRLDPRTKIIATALWILLLFLTHSIAGFVADTIFLVLITLSSRIPLLVVLRSTKPIIPIVLFTSFFNILYTSGDVIWSAWIFQITKQGIEISAFLSLRILLMVMGSSILTFTTSLTDITSGIESLLSPLERVGVRITDFAMMVTLAIRFIPTLSEEVQKIKDAQRARGASFGSKKITQKIKEVFPILVPLIYSSFRRAFDLTNAIECRCYNQKIKRTKLNPLKYQKRDLFCGIIIVLFFSIIIIIQK
ncbi:ecfT protein [Liquorilactobacillus sucicola DSM 21376 = JCM 15457]|uniref:EcfT protein n=1 Tax=Liquorilactobacillus sucicola DSM 21376 = JCM 15457 TaxID=1423806 RepID=A0A0R2DQA4_9LACO|nr:ecfT protein [Liquorilactobacillus sucicola DSM 21376 = JCM 15457]